MVTEFSKLTGCNPLNFPDKQSNEKLTILQWLSLMYSLAFLHFKVVKNYFILLLNKFLKA